VDIVKYRLKSIRLRLVREKRRYGLKKSYWSKEVARLSPNSWEHDSAKAKLFGVSDVYDDIVAEIACVDYLLKQYK